MQYDNNYSRDTAILLGLTSDRHCYILIDDGHNYWECNIENQRQFMIDNPDGEIVLLRSCGAHVSTTYDIRNLLHEDIPFPIANCKEVKYRRFPHRIIREDSISL